MTHRADRREKFEPVAVTSPEAFADTFHLSPEVLEKTQTYEAELRRWQTAVNLVSPNTLPSLWQRHFADSAQLTEFIPPSARTLVDLGSGAGFPGLVLAILLEPRGVSVTLIESDQRKAAFLRHVIRTVDIDTAVLSTRIETDANVRRIGKIDVVTARALAPLSRLLTLAWPFCSASTVCVFPKGRNVASELAVAEQDWRFVVQLKPSRTDCDGQIAMVRDIEPAQGG